MKFVRNSFVWWGRASALVCGLLLLAGCQTWEQYNANNAKPGAAQPARVDYSTIRVDENLTVEFLDINPVQKLEVKVQSDGSIPLPLNQRAPAEGKSVPQLEKEIRALYVPRYYNHLTVLVKRENLFFSVGGEVRKPSNIGYAGDMTVIKAIQAAGDFTIYANKKKIQVIRTDGKIDVVNYNDALKDPKKDLAVYPGDRIHVPLAPF